MKNTKVLIAGYLGMFFFGTAFIVMGAVLPSLTALFNLDEATAASIVSMSPLGMLFGSIIFGPIIDKYGYKPIMLAAMLLGTAGLEIMAFVPNINMIRCAIFLLGISGGILNGATNALVADASDDKSKGSNLSLLGFIYCVGAFTIPILFALLSEQYSYVPIVAGTGALMFITFIFYLFVDFPKAKVQQGFPIKKVLGMAKEPVLLLFSFVLFFQSGIEGLANNWSPKFLNEVKGFQMEQVQYALSFIVVGMAISRLTLTFLLKKIDGGRVISISMLISALGAFTMRFASTMPLAILGAVLLGLGLAATFPVVLGKIGEKYKELSGTAIGFALIIALTGNTILNFLIGQIGLGNLPTMLIISMILLVIIFSFATKQNNK